MDLINTTFFDCSGISVLVAARNVLADDAKLVLRRPQQFIAQVLQMLKLATDWVTVD